MGWIGSESKYWARRRIPCGTATAPAFHRISSALQDRAVWGGSQPWYLPLPSRLPAGIPLAPGHGKVAGTPPSPRG
jgi:hypothetical protein